MKEETQYIETNEQLIEAGRKGNNDAFKGNGALAFDNMRYEKKTVPSKEQRREQNMKWFQMCRLTLPI